MYIPKYFEQNDRCKILAFMQAYNFAIIVSAENGLPLATHLPFVIEERNDDIILVSHMSKANPQWKTLEGKEVLVIFAEPHAYISPSLYEHAQNVPTWNYIAVHAYGNFRALESDAQKLDVLHKQMRTFEENYLKQFKTLDSKYVDGLLKGIVAFEIEVTKLQGKEKLSQNKKETERQTIKEHLLQSEDTGKKDIGKHM